MHRPISLPLSSLSLYFEKLFYDDFGFLQVQRKKFRTRHTVQLKTKQKKKGTHLSVYTTECFLLEELSQSLKTPRDNKIGD